MEPVITVDSRSAMFYTLLKIRFNIQFGSIFHLFSSTGCFPFFPSLFQYSSFFLSGRMGWKIFYRRGTVFIGSRDFLNESEQKKCLLCSLHYVPDFLLTQIYFHIRLF